MRSSSRWLTPLLLLGTAVLAGCAEADLPAPYDGDAEDDEGRGRPQQDAQSSDVGVDAAAPDGSDNTDAGRPDVASDVADTDTTGADTDASDVAAPETPESDSSEADADVDDAPDPACSDKLTYVYVISKDKQLLQFDPESGEFTAVGEVDCGEFSDTTPSSMAMSRLGNALVNYSDNSLQSVNIDDAACTESGWSPGTGGFERFGMGYVADRVGGSETLYISNRTTLATLDPATWTVREIGRLPSQSELTGTGNGELWGFFPLESPPQILQLSREDASVLRSFDLPPLPPDLDTFAFTAWGGDFYLFYRLYGLGETTTVYRFDRATETLEQVVADSGFNVVGAGVSICAPTSR